MSSFPPLPYQPWLGATGSSGGAYVPPGNNPGDQLIWSGSQWLAAASNARAVLEMEYSTGYGSPALNHWQANNADTTLATQVRFSRNDYTGADVDSIMLGLQVGQRFGGVQINDEDRRFGFTVAGLPELEGGSTYWQIDVTAGSSGTQNLQNNRPNLIFFPTVGGAAGGVYPTYAASITSTLITNVQPERVGLAGLLAAPDYVLSSNAVQINYTGLVRATAVFSMRSSDGTSPVSGQVEFLLNGLRTANGLQELGTPATTDRVVIQDVTAVATGDVVLLQAMNFLGHNLYAERGTLLLQRVT